MATAVPFRTMEVGQYLKRSGDGLHYCPEAPDHGSSLRQSWPANNALVETEFGHSLQQQDLQPQMSEPVFDPVH